MAIELIDSSVPELCRIRFRAIRVGFDAQIFELKTPYSLVYRIENNFSISNNRVYKNIIFPRHIFGTDVQHSFTINSILWDWKGLWYTCEMRDGLSAK